MPKCNFNPLPAMPALPALAGNAAAASFIAGTLFSTTASVVAAQDKELADKESAKAALLEKLGLSADEAALLLE